MAWALQTKVYGASRKYFMLKILKKPFLKSVESWWYCDNTRVRNNFIISIQFYLYKDSNEFLKAGLNFVFISKTGVQKASNLFSSHQIFSEQSTEVIIPSTKPI